MSRGRYFAKFHNLNFWHLFFQICNIDFVLFWLGIWYDKYLIQVTSFEPTIHILRISFSHVSYHTIQYNTNVILVTFYHTPCFNEVDRRCTGFRSSVGLSVCLSVRLWTKSCPLCDFHNTSWIHFISTLLIKQPQVCREEDLLPNSTIWIFGIFFFSNL